MTFLKAHDAQKNSHFRTWKSGKNWLYAASALTILTGLSMGGTLFASASTVQINYTQPAANSGQAVYAYVWGTGSSADGNFTALTNVAGTSNYTVTLPEGNTGGDVGIILINKGDWSGTKLISTSNQQFENNAFTAGKSLIVNVDATGNPTETDFNEPTITAPTSLKATVNSPINLSATVSNPDQLATKKGLQVSVNGTIISNPAAYVPTTNGSEKVDYSYDYTLPNGSIETATKEVMLLVGTLFAPADVTETIATGNTSYSFTPQTVTDINGGSTTSVINDSNNTKLTALADGSYNLSAGKYTVVYTGINSSPATVTQNVTIKQAPVSVNVHYYNPSGYTGWNFWKWGDGNGTSTNFSGTSTAADGSVWDNGSLTYDTSATDGNFSSSSFTSVNFIVRQSTAQNAWAAQTQNLSVALNPDGTPTHSDIYVVAGDNTHVYYDEASAMAAYTKAQEVVNMDWSKFDSQYDYEGTMGAIYSPASTTFKVWAPTTDVTGVAKVQLVDYGVTTNSVADLTLTAQRVIDMTQGTVASTDPTQNTIGLWSTVVAGDMKNHVYAYRVTCTDGTVKETQDPYSTAVIVNGQKSVVIDPADTTPTGFVAAQGAAATWRVSDPTKAVIQEMNIRDFTIDPSSGVSAVNAGKYLGVIQTGTKNSSGAATGLDYLKQLGVNYVQIMPSADFASVDETGAGSQQNWGYDPENYNVPEGSYSSDPENPLTRILEFKEMVQGLHNSGLGVIMDVVYPHQANQSTSPFQIVAPNYYFRLSNGSGCGNDTASERDMYSDYIVNSVLNWVQTYDVDGFRFDQMMQIDTATMNEIRAKLSAIDPNIILYGEGWNGSSTALPASEMSDQDNIQQIPGIGVFNDIARDSIKGSDVYSQTAPKTGFVNGLSTGNSVFSDTEAAVADVIMGTHTAVEGKSIPALTPSQIINFVEVHDNATLNDLIWKENPLDDQATHNLRVQLANTINLLAQGVPLMETGQEFDRTKEPGTVGNSTDQTVFATAANSYNAGDSVNGVDWNLATTNSSMVNFIQQVIAFRKAHPAFQLDSYAAISNQVKITNATAGSGIITYEVTEGANTYLVIYNASGKALSLGLDGSLYQTTNFTNASVQVSDAVGLTANQTVGSSTVTVSDLSATILLLNPTSQLLPTTPTTPTTTTPAVTPTTSTTTTPVVTAPSATITPVLSTNSNVVYRLYNQKTGQHLWTVNTLEVSTLKNSGWKIEHSSLTSISQGIPVYRLYNAKTGDHFYTTNLLERNHAIKVLGYQSEGIAFDVPNTGEKVYRLYNSTSKLHFYTTDMNEIATIIKNGYHLEGLAWHV